MIVLFGIHIICRIDTISRIINYIYSNGSIIEWYINIFFSISSTISSINTTLISDTLGACIIRPCGVLTVGNGLVSMRICVYKLLSVFTNIWFIINRCCIKLFSWCTNIYTFIKCIGSIIHWCINNCWFIIKCISSIINWLFRWCKDCIIIINIYICSIFSNWFIIKCIYTHICCIIKWYFRCCCSGNIIIDLTSISTISNIVLSIGVILGVYIIRSSLIGPSLFIFSTLLAIVLARILAALQIALSSGYLAAASASIDHSNHSIVALLINIQKQSHSNNNDLQNLTFKKSSNCNIYKLTINPLTWYSFYSLTGRLSIIKLNGENPHQPWYLNPLTWYSFNSLTGRLSIITFNNKLQLINDYKHITRNYMMNTLNKKQIHLIKMQIWSNNIITSISDRIKIRESNHNNSMYTIHGNKLLFKQKRNQNLSSVKKKHGIMFSTIQLYQTMTLKSGQISEHLETNDISKPMTS